MSYKKSRSRKTSDRMAVYKANATRGRTRQATAPTRVSPRTSPRGKMPYSVKSSSPSKRMPVAKRSTEDKPVGSEEWNKTLVPTPFDDLEQVPETPPRVLLCSGHKRVNAPRRSIEHSMPDKECMSGDECDMPSKKRKLFKTPPRREGSSAMTDRLRNNLSGSDSEEFNVRSDGDSPSAERSFSLIDKKDDLGSRREEASNIRDTELVRRSERERCNARSGPSGQHIGKRASFVSPGDLNMLSVSSATVTRFLEEFRSRMMSEFSVMQKENVCEMRRIGDAVTASVVSQMQHMEGLFSMISGGMTGMRAQKAGKTKLTEWEQKLDALTSDVKLLFNKEVLARILCFNTIVKAASVYRGQEGDEVERAALSAQTLLFSLQVGEKKFSFSGKVGSLHSEFKFTIVQNSFFNLSRNSFGFFDDHDNASQDKGSYSSSDHSGTTRAMSNHRVSSSAAGFKTIKRPIWLEKGKVNSDHINEARGFLERANQSRKNKVRRTPGPDDIAVHAALRVYRLLGNYLHVRRGAVRNKFFQSLGYLLVRWSDHVKDNEQDLMNMAWDTGDASLRLRLDSVPCTEQCNINADEATVTTIDATNKSLLRKLFSEYSGMVLAVEHQVHVVSGNGSQRRHVGGDLTTIHRLISLIDVACNICVEYSGVDGIEVFLRSHRYSLQCVMIFALLLKAFCVKFMERRESVNSSAAGSGRGDSGSVDLGDVIVGGMSVKDLIPGPTMQKNLLESRCLRMTRTEFNTHNHCADEANHPGNVEESNVGGFGMVAIEESEEMGIGMI